MRVCIVGAGAIGTLMGARLAASGRSVSAIARGATLAALRTHGWRLRTGKGLVSGPVRASDDPGELGPQDLVIVAVKGPAMPGVAPTIGRLTGPGTVVLPAMNGIPWWFCEGLPAPAGGPLESVDPGGAIAAAIPSERVLGCVVHASATTVEPGLVEHVRGHGIIVGEPGGGDSERLARIAGILEEAGFEVTRSPRIRTDIWYKLWGNLTMNPVSALTGATADRVLDDPLVRAFNSSAMNEAAAIGERIGCSVGQTAEERHAVTRRLGAFKTSMLQDAEAGRPLELDAIMGAAREIGRRVGVPTPNIDALFGLARLYARVRGLYPAGDGVASGR